SRIGLSIFDGIGAIGSAGVTGAKQCGDETGFVLRKCAICMEAACVKDQRSVMIATSHTSVAGEKRYRSVWISDIHLGTKHAQVDALLDFLREVECRYLYLVGDFIDGWQLRSRWRWQDSYNVLIQKLLRKSRKETKIIYLSGNHDEFLENFLNVNFGS